MTAAPIATAMPPPDPHAAIRERLLAAGFTAVGFAAPDAAAAAGARLHDFIRAGRHGEMRWLAAQAERRADPRVLWPAARTAIVVGANYAPARDPLADLARNECGTISVYAARRDYHDVIGGRLRETGRWIAATYGAECKSFVDTAPLLEKPLAAAAGIGWQGKHTNLVSPALGSWLFLGVILTTLDLAPSAPGEDRCGSCRACLDVCPTAAFPAPYQLDARRCISYLTIEHKGPIAREFRRAIGNRIFGCDDCLAVCPWNKFAHVASDLELAVRPDLTLPALAELAGLDDAAFRARFRGTALKRTGRDRLVRNVAIALGNSGAAAAVPALEGLCRDPAPLVRAMAVWGLGELYDRPARAALKARILRDDADPAVRAEAEALDA
jgi:epoxyqueuosine reductase